MSKANGKCFWVKNCTLSRYKRSCRYCKRDETYTSNIRVMVPERKDGETLKDYFERVEACKMPYYEKIICAMEMNDRPCEALVAKKEK